MSLAKSLVAQKLNFSPFPFRRNSSIILIIILTPFSLLALKVFNGISITSAKWNNVAFSKVGIRSCIIERTFHHVVVECHFTDVHLGIEFNLKIIQRLIKHKRITGASYAVTEMKQIITY